MLESGRMVCTINWNPLIFAFVFDQEHILTFVEQNETKLDLELLLRVHEIIPNVPMQNNSERQQFHNFLTLVIENQSKNAFKLLLGKLSYLLKEEDFVFIFDAISRLIGGPIEQFADYAMFKVLNS